MVNSFLIGVISFGLILAIIQDIKRKEIDNWLNLLIFISGTIYILIESIITKEYFILFYFLMTFIGIFLLANILYYSNIFAGGDYHLLIALTPLFVTTQFNLIFSNIFLFLILLIFSGSFYSLFFSIFLYFKNFKKIKEETKKELRKINKILFNYFNNNNPINFYFFSINFNSNFININTFFIFNCKGLTRKSFNKKNKCKKFKSG